MTAQDTNETIDESLARIDSQDESFILPIRQYLEAHGCIVSAGKSFGKIPQYHIAAGDENFVKRIFAEYNNGATRRLALVVDGMGENPTDFFNAIDAKIVLLLPRPIAAREVEQIFAFFFTGDQTVLDLVPPGSLKPSKKILPHEDEVRKEEDEDRISKTMQEIFQSKEKRVDQNSSVRRTEKRTRSSWLRLLLFIFFIIILPVAWYVLCAFMTIGSLALSGKLLSQGNIAYAKRSEQASGFWITQGKGTLTILGFPAALLNRQSFVHKQEQLWSILADLQKGLDGGVTAIENGKLVMQTLLVNDPAQKEGGLAKGIDDIRNSLFLVQTHLGLAQGELKDFLSQNQMPFLEKINNPLSKIRSDTETMDNLLSLYQKIGGFSQKKTYLLLFQNSMELRPTGGFIGSVGVATLTDGKLTDFQIQDVYTVDGQLKGHVDPPEEVASLLHQEHWYLRDSNWDPNFSVSGPRAGWFYEKETGITVDGVIGVNVPLIQALLSATGPITLTDYNDRITAENFFGKSLYYTQGNFFPGSTQKKDFLGTLANAIIDKLTTQKNIDSFSVFRSIAKGLANHDVLFSFSDPQLESLAVNLGWGGAVPQKTSSCENTAECLLDYAYLVDANMGVNKVNYFMKRNMIREIAVGESGSVKETITVSYQNTSVSDTGGGGNYRNYLRVYIPSDSALTSVSIDGQPVHNKPEQTKTPAQLPYTKTEPSIGNLSGIGIAFDVPASSEHRLVVSYERKKPLTFIGGKSSMMVFTQRQPGSINTTIQTTVSYPIFWTGKAAPGQTGEVGAKQVFLAKDAQFEYNTDLLEDQELKLTFLK